MTEQTERQVNIPLLRKAVEWAEAEAAKPPELSEWEQRLYVLPLTVDEVGGRAFGSQQNLDRAREEAGRASECGTCYCIAGYIASVSGRPWDYFSAAEVAAEELGTEYCSGLFHASNTIEDVRRIAEDLAGERL